MQATKEEARAAFIKAGLAVDEANETFEYIADTFLARECSREELFDAAVQLHTARIEAEALEIQYALKGRMSGIERTGKETRLAEIHRQLSSTGNA